VEATLAIEYGDGKAGQYAKSQAQKQIERLDHYRSCRNDSDVADRNLHWVYARVLARPAFRMGAKDFLLKLTVASNRCSSRGASCARTIDPCSAPASQLSDARTVEVASRWPEALIVMLLRDLDDHWHLFNNVKLKTGGDLDHVLIGPGGVFCISKKSIKGTYSISPAGSHLLNGSVTDQLVEAKTLALKLRNWLEVKLHDSSQVRKVPWIQPILATPFARVAFASQQQTAWVMDDDLLIETLRDYPRTLNTNITTISACVSVLQEITKLNPRPSLSNSALSK
jgi:hypothetical protein